MKETNAERLRRLRAVAVAKGLCYVCRCRAVRTGTRYCEDCIVSANTRRGETYADRVARGVCPGCGGEPLPGLVLCVRHHARSLESRQRVYRRRVAAGLCAACGDCAPECGKKFCRPCLDGYAELMARREIDLFIAGRCQRCGRKKRCAQVWCKACRERHAEGVKRRAAERAQETA